MKIDVTVNFMHHNSDETFRRLFLRLPSLEELHFFVGLNDAMETCNDSPAFSFDATLGIS
jgi:hypothetical protein